MGILEYFNCIIISGDNGISKPDKRIFIEACELLKRQPGDCLYIGDSYENDIIGSKTAGMFSCWYNPSHVEDKQEIEPDLIIDKFEQLLSLL
jgi:putative hydrolase of the HAD superfamily